MMSGIFVRLHLFLARYRVWVLFSVGVFAAVALFLTRHLRLHEDYTDMLPISDPAIARQVEALKRIRQADRMFFDIAVTKDGPVVLGEAAERMSQALAEIPELTDIRGSFDGGEALDILRSLEARLPLLMSAQDLAAIENRLEPQQLIQRLRWFKENLNKPQGFMLHLAAQADPVGISDPVLAHLQALQAGAGDARIVAGRITSADGRHVLITALPVFKPSETAKSKKLIQQVITLARNVEREFSSGSVRIAVSGAHRIGLDNATIIQHDSKRASIIATLAVAALLLGAYRRPLLSLLGLLPTGIGALAAVVAFYLTGEPVSAVAVGCGSILIGVTVDYGIYVLYHTDDSPPGTRDAMARIVARMIPTVTFGAVTTLSAFLVMFASPIAGHRQLGIFGVIGVAIAAVFALLVLPIFIPVAPATRTALLPLSRWMERLLSSRVSGSHWVWPALILLSLVCAVGAARLRFEGDLARFNGVSPETAADEATIRNTWGKALALTTLVVSGTNRDEVLDKNERLRELMQNLQRQGLVENYSSTAPLFPSAATRRAHVAAWQNFWTPQRVSQVTNALLSASVELGFRSDAFSEFVHRIASPPEPAAGEVPDDTASSKLVADYSNSQDGGLSMLTLAKVRTTGDYLMLQDAVLKSLPGALLLNKAALGEDIVRIAKHGLPIFAALVVALNVLLLLLFFGRLSLAGITLLPMAAGVFWTLGLLGLFGLPIDMSNFIFVVLVIGLSGDYSLFLVMAELSVLRGESSQVASTGAAVTLCALTTIFGVGVLALAQHPALFSIGLSALLGISLSLLAALLLVPLCMTALCRYAHRVAADAVASGGISAPELRWRTGRLYQYQEPYVTHFVSWKMRLDPLFKHLDAIVPRKASVLDLGSGYGLAGHWLTLSSPERKVLGLDADAGKVRVARVTARANPAVRFEERDVLTGDYPPCDCVLMLDLLHYMPRDQKAEVLQKASAALGPGGLLVLRDAFRVENAKHRLVALSEKCAVLLGQNKTSFGLHFETRDEHLQLLREAGFSQIREQKDAGLGSNTMLVCRK